MKQFATKGIVLRRTNFGEADRIITVLTHDQGKIRLVAKGVRRIKSKLAGGIELLSINDLTYMPGKGDLGTLISARLVTNFGHIVTDVDRTMYTYEVLKLIDRTTEDSPEPEYFQLLAAVLQGIDAADLDLGWVRLWFNLQLLILSGHGPNLQTDANGGELDAQSKFTFSFEEMSFTPHSAGVFDARSVKLLRLTERAASPLLLGRISGGQELLAPLVQLTRTMLMEHGHKVA